MTTITTTTRTFYIHESTFEVHESIQESIEHNDPFIDVFELVILETGTEIKTQISVAISHIVEYH
jgi:hypothetical protein